MANTFTYSELSLNGLTKAYSDYVQVEPQNGQIQIDNAFGKVNMQALTLPGDIDILFTEYECKVDIFLEHLPEKEQRFALFIDCAETGKQQFIINNYLVKDLKADRNYAYLMNSIFPYNQYRTAGTKGRSLFIFIPTYLLKNFTINIDDESILGKFYALQNEGESFAILEENELQKLNSFFYQWNNFKNILGLTKYTYQFIEWYLKKMISFFTEDKTTQKLLPHEAVALLKVEQYIKASLHLPNLDVAVLQNISDTNIGKLRMLFVKNYDQSLAAYFKNAKLKKAKEQIENSDKTIAEIAYEFGYANPSNFSASFKKLFDIGPIECKQLQHKLNTQ
jgi:AraC-like DNA-binding protein